MAKRLFEQGIDVNPIGTNRVAHGKSATSTSNSTWNTIVTWLRTALQDVTHRFATDAEKATWNAKMEDSKAAIEAQLTGTITSHNHPPTTPGITLLELTTFTMGTGTCVASKTTYSNGLKLVTLKIVGTFGGGVSMSLGTVLATIPAGYTPSIRQAQFCTYVKTDTSQRDHVLRAYPSSDATYPSKIVVGNVGDSGTAQNIGTTFTYQVD